MNERNIEQRFYRKVIFCSCAVRSGWKLKSRFTIDRRDSMMTLGQWHKDFVRLTESSVISVKINV